MNVTANVSRRRTYLNQVGTRPTLESYLLAMEPYIAAISTRSQVAIDLDSQEDLEQEARMTLVAVFQDYGKKKKPIELYKIGTRAIANHFRDLYESATSVARGGSGTHEIRRGRVEPDHYRPVQILSTATGRDEIEVLDSIAIQADQLDRVLVREALDKILAAATAVERRTFRAAIQPDQIRGLDTAEARAIFRDLRRKMRRQVRFALEK